MSSQPTDGRLVRIARSAGALAQRLTRGVAFFTGASAGAGVVLWGLIWWPPEAQATALLGALATLLVLLAPAIVLGLFYAGLRDLVALPERVSAHASATVQASAATYRAATQEAAGSFGRLRRVLMRIWALRTLLLDHRMLLLRYAAMLRFLTPGFLLLVVGAVGATMLLLLAAGLGLTAVLL